jgi:hypothetical protein
MTAGLASHTAPLASTAVTPIQTAIWGAPCNPDDAHKPAAVVTIPAPSP